MPGEAQPDRRLARHLAIDRAIDHWSQEDVLTFAIFAESEPVIPTVESDRAIDWPLALPWC